MQSDGWPQGAQEPFPDLVSQRLTGQTADAASAPQELRDSVPSQPALLQILAESYFHSQFLKRHFCYQVHLLELPVHLDGSAPFREMHIPGPPQTERQNCAVFTFVKLSTVPGARSKISKRLLNKCDCTSRNRSITMVVGTTELQPDSPTV